MQEEIGLASAREKFYAAAGSLYEQCPEDHVADEKIKFIPAPMGNHLLALYSDPTDKGLKNSSAVLQATKHFWLHADTIGGKYGCSRKSREKL